VANRILRGLALFVLLLVVAFAGVWILSAAVEARYVYPNAGTKSAFLAQYSPNQVVDGFRCGKESYGWGASASSNAGRQFAEHHDWWITYLLVKPGNESALMAAVQEDIRARLNGAGAQVIQPESESSADLSQGLRLRYMLGNTKGFVALRSLKHVRPEDTHIYPVPFGKDYVEFRMEVGERWFRSPQEARDGNWPESKDQNIRID
jgi:hypothetical protein